ncbi:MAG TPA: endonuclease, partial [Zoogloea sp.]|nr:endonuclease [Zoogloea sp.]
MKLLSWNIQWGRGADGVVDLQRTIAAIRTLGEFDVLCLQEVSIGFAGLH